MTSPVDADADADALSKRPGLQVAADAVTARLKKGVPFKNTTSPSYSTLFNGVMMCRMMEVFVWEEGHKGRCFIRPISLQFISSWSEILIRRWKRRRAYWRERDEMTN